MPAMPNPAALQGSLADPIEQAGLVKGFVSTNREAPTGFPNGTENLLWVIIPDYSLERPVGPCQWTAEWGTTLPKQGTPVLVAFDEENFPIVVWWEGSYTAPVPAEESITEAMFAKAVKEALKPGAWVSLSLISKMEANTALQTPAARLEQAGSVLRLRGGPQVKSGQELKANETFATLPVGQRPSTLVAIGLAYPAGNASLQLSISSGGAMSLSGTITQTLTFFLDSVTFNLT